MKSLNINRLELKEIIMSFIARGKGGIDIQKFFLHSRVKRSTYTINTNFIV